jgi:hypothetical protein
LYQGPAHSQVCERWIKKRLIGSSISLHPSRGLALPGPKSFKKKRNSLKLAYTKAQLTHKVVRHEQKKKKVVQA